MIISGGSFFAPLVGWYPHFGQAHMPVRILAEVTVTALKVYLTASSRATRVTDTQFKFTVCHPFHEREQIQVEA
jgi:hypothetical protein